MKPPRTAGFPRMMQEGGEKRVFMPELVRTLTGLGLNVYLEEGYGTRSDLTAGDYRREEESVHACSRADAFGQDIVFLLRSPQDAEFELLKPGACLVSMLHFPTRPLRVEFLKRLEINAISLDGIANDVGVRLVENMKAVAWNGLEAAFRVLERKSPERLKPGEEPLRVVVLGTGMVGRHALDAATKMGNRGRNNKHMADGAPGVLAIGAGRNITARPATVERLFRDTDILVDASQRSDPSKPIVPNEWIGWLPRHAVIADLAVDPYILEATPPIVRGVEGIPQGDLDKHIFLAGDPEWERGVPPSIPATHRRAVVSCYSWPGIYPDACMRHYGQQLDPMLEPLVRLGYDGLSAVGGYFERALYRGTLRCWLASVGSEKDRSVE
ncbi:MAG: alanine dehydrogenase [Acidobacteria bacterium]|nr:alanine dehydrogenase [Acidobacteriota bacterium]